MTQTMTIKEFMSNTPSNQPHLSELEQQQWELMKLTCKAILIVSALVLPLNLDGILNFTNEALDAYLNQFFGNGIEAYLSK